MPEREMDSSTWVVIVSKSRTKITNNLHIGHHYIPHELNEKNKFETPTKKKNKKK